MISKDDFTQKQKRAREFIHSYLQARQGLTDLGILRSGRSLQGEYAEWLVANILDLKLEASTVQKAIDARDANDHSYQIKSRITESLEKNTSFDFSIIGPYFDYLVCVFFSLEFEVLSVIRIPYDVVRELGFQNETTFRFRWNKQTASDPRIERII